MASSRSNMDKPEQKLLSRHETLEQEMFSSVDDLSSFDPRDAEIWPLKTKARNPPFVFWGIILLLFSFILGIFGTLVYNKGIISENPSVRELQWASCGNSSQEAINNGCILDFISGAWVHSACYDAEIEQEFLELEEWHWYHDRERQHEMSLEFIRRTGGPDPIYVSEEYHRQHCLYTWKKFHRAVIRKVPIDDHIGGYRHTEHCVDALAITNRTAPARFYNIFTSCMMPGYFELDMITP